MPSLHVCMPCVLAAAALLLYRMSLDAALAQAGLPKSLVACALMLFELAVLRKCIIAA